MAKECVRIHAPNVGALGLRLVYLCLEKLQAMQIKEYKVVKVDYLVEFQKEVNAAISAGWEPQGGVFLKEHKYYQAMVKRG